MVRDKISEVRLEFCAIASFVTWGAYLAFLSLSGLNEKKYVKLPNTELDTETALPLCYDRGLEDKEGCSQARYVI